MAALGRNSNKNRHYRASFTTRSCPGHLCREPLRKAFCVERWYSQLRGMRETRREREMHLDKMPRDLREKERKRGHSVVQYFFEFSVIDAMPGRKLRLVHAFACDPGCDAAIGHDGRRQASIKTNKETSQASTSPSTDRSRKADTKTKCWKEGVVWVRDHLLERPGNNCGILRRRKNLKHMTHVGARDAALASEEDIATAVAVLEGTLDDHSVAPIIYYPLPPEHPYALEFMISSINHVTSEYILGFIFNKFIPNICVFRSSLGYEIVSRLSCFLSQLPHPSNGRPEGLDHRCHGIQMALTILEDLSLLLQSGSLEEVESEGRTRESAEKMIESIVNTQKDTVKGVRGEIGATRSLSTTWRKQADLYFPPAAGFGQWHILCSRTFLSDMTRDNTLSKTVLERLRDGPIDVFRARLPGSTRLVVRTASTFPLLAILTLYKYPIDVVPEFGRDHDIQGSVVEVLF
ncbi:hypothetical protein EDB87DRAFT_1574733 [Lactarius vividus]|nr:hypothetical protein EDB87DRAFT_1574733 [Lactarius vividus]